MHTSSHHRCGRVVTSVVLTVLATCIVGCATPDTEVQEEWKVRQWRPTAWTPVHDVESGVTASLLGPMPADAGLPMFGYRSTQGPVEVETRITIVRRPDESPEQPVAQPDLQRSAELSAEIHAGTLTDSHQLTVSDKPAIDLRIQLSDQSGKPKVVLQRQVYLPEHLVILESTGAAAEERVAAQVQRLALEKLVLP